MDEADLLSHAERNHYRQHARAFLSEKLAAASTLPCDLPARPAALAAWIERNSVKVGEQYRDYLNARKTGSARQYFSGKSHAYYFLNAVAPTKLVDGAWLYGLCKRWDDPRFSSLIRIYLEELGEGLPNKNHVLLYRKLLAMHGSDRWHRFEDTYFEQGAIQIALSMHAADFLPEVIGFNLGYEQLPLHLLITAYELDELGIDPYYFTLHVTVDNAATGHAQKAMQSVFDAMPQVADREEFYRRIMNGYRLNMLGIDTLTAIRSFDLERELLAVMAEKAKLGSQLHSDYCRVAGRTINDWLAEPGHLPELLSNLQKMGWINRHQHPQNSRFWNLIHGERAPMFGVFSAYEQQLIWDWIGGDWLTKRTGSEGGPPRELAFRARKRLYEALNQGRRYAHPSIGTRGVIRTHADHDKSNGEDDFNADLRELERKLSALPGREEVMAELVELMSPARHHTAAGLMATRIFTRMLQST